MHWSPRSPVKVCMNGSNSVWRDSNVLPRLLNGVAMNNYTKMF